MYQQLVVSAVCIVHAQIQDVRGLETLKFHDYNHSKSRENERRTFFRQALNTTTKKISYFTAHIIFHCFHPFHCFLSVILWPEEGDFPEKLHRVVYVIINKRSFESFMCLNVEQTNKNKNHHRTHQTNGGEGSSLLRVGTKNKKKKKKIYK